MIEINKNLNSKLNDINLDNFYVIADFDKTITSKQSNTTFSLFSKSGFYPEEYLKERNVEISKIGLTSGNACDTILKL